MGSRVSSGEHKVAGNLDNRLSGASFEGSVRMT